MKIVLLGPPGAGKGTQGEFLIRDLGFVRVSTGDMLRDHVARGTDLGKRAKTYMDRGELVPDEIIVGMIKEKLGAENLILDGFPRNIPQAEALEALLGAENEGLDAVVLLDLPDEEAVRRLVSRRVCRGCGAVYNLITHPPQEEGLCDACGGELVQRDDDTEETVRHRLAVYRQSTEPLVNFYEKRGLLRRVRATGTPRQVYEELKRVLGL